MIKIITDSTADLPRSVIEKYDIDVLPLTVHFGTETFKDGIELDGEQFFKMLKSETAFPTTSQITPGVFMETFDKYIDYDLVIYVAVSSELSGTCSVAELVSQDYPNVLVFDSKQVTFAEGMLVVALCRHLEKINSKEAAQKFLRIASNRLQSYFIVDTLEYLVKGGRLSKVKGMVGSVLRLKPVLTLKEGKLESLATERGRLKAMNFVIERLREDFSDKKIPALGIYHALDEEGLYQFKNLILREFEVSEIIEAEVGSVVGAHAGPGCIAISYFKD